MRSSGKGGGQGGTVGGLGGTTEGTVGGLQGDSGDHRGDRRGTAAITVYLYNTSYNNISSLFRLEQVLSTTSRARNIAGVNHIFFVLAVVTTEDSFFAILDEEAIPCDTDITIAVDRVFKLHYIMNLEYPQELYSFYVFLERCLFNIYVSKKVPSSVRELDNSLAVIDLVDKQNVSPFQGVLEV